MRFAYDAAQCTGPWNCDLNFERSRPQLQVIDILKRASKIATNPPRYGYFVGCNNLGEFPFPTYKIYYEDAKPEPWNNKAGKDRNGLNKSCVVKVVHSSGILLFQQLQGLWD